MSLTRGLQRRAPLRGLYSPVAIVGSGAPDVSTLVDDVQVFWQFSQDTTGYDTDQSAFIADIGTVPLYDDGTMGDGDNTLESKYHEGLMDTCAYSAANQGYMYADDWGVLRAPTNGDMTWAMWLRPDQGQDTIDLFSKIGVGGGGANHTEYIASIDGGLLVWLSSDGISIGTISTDVSTLLLSDGGWHLLILDYDHTLARGSIYLDDQLLRHGAMPQPQSGTGSFTLMGGSNYDGDIWGVGKWDRLWTPTERTNYYNSGAGVSLVSLTD